MPFIALHPEVGRIDATQPDLGAGLAWSQVYKVSPRVPLTCPECTWGVHAKHSPKRVRYFCHDGGRPPECLLANESWEHHMLKLEMAGAIRAAGWYAELEVAAADGSWRADVMASSPDGTQRIAWEAQLSPITVEDIQARTDRYAAEEVAVCWVSPQKKPPVWLGAVPSVRVRVPERSAETWVVDDGLGGFASSTWFFRETQLAQFVKWVVRGQLRVCRSLPHHRRVMRDIGTGSHRWFVRDLWWTSRQSAEAQYACEQERIRREEQARRREEEARRQEARRLELEAASQARRAAWRASPAGQQALQRRLEVKKAKALQEAERQAAARRLKAQRDEEKARYRAEVRARQAREFALEQEREAARQAAREELERRAQATAEMWWGQLSGAQVKELFAAVIDTAWKDDGLRVRIPEGGGVAASFAYGVPVHADHRLYGIVRPCPELLPLSPQLAYHQVFARNAKEARALEENGLRTERLTHLALADHEQMVLC